MAPPKLDPRILTALGLSLIAKGCGVEEDSGKGVFATACLSMIVEEETQETSTESCLSIAHETGDTGEETRETGEPLDTGDSGMTETGAESRGMQESHRAVHIPTHTAEELRRSIREKLLHNGTLPSDLHDEK